MSCSFWRLTPPLALISSTYISSVFFSGSPRNDAGPVTDSTAPIFTCAAAGWATRHNAPSATAAATCFNADMRNPPCWLIYAPARPLVMRGLTRASDGRAVPSLSEMAGTSPAMTDERTRPSPSPVVLHQAVAHDARQVGEVAVAGTGADRGRQRGERAGRHRHGDARQGARRHRRHHVLAQAAQVEGHVGLLALEHRDLGGEPVGGGRRLQQHVEHLVQRQALADA